MSDAKTHFDALADTLSAEGEAITQGKMMHSDGIAYKGKNFAFFHENDMVVKLGRDNPPDNYGVGNYRVLSPFKTKPPLKDWFHISVSESDLWETLARHALQRMIEQVDGQ